MIGKMKFVMFAVTALICSGCATTEAPVTPSKQVEEVDRIVVEKKAHVMKVYRGPELLKTYKVSLGFNPVGHKVQEGDGKTPEGVYKIAFKKPSKYHRALKVSYPNRQDAKTAYKKGIRPGGDIMIHGLGKQLSHLGASHIEQDWTQGCIAVTDREIEELYEAVEPNTTIEIKT